MWVFGTQALSLSCRVCAYTGVRAAPGSGTSHWFWRAGGRELEEEPSRLEFVPLCPSRPGTALALDGHHWQV